VTASVDNVLRDLYECLCLLQKDGVDTVFVHRSFQEYFCALFMANYHGPQLRPMLEKVAHRWVDEVMTMLFEMARDKVDREWVVPQIDEVTSGFNDVINEQSCAEFLCKFIGSGVYQLDWKSSGEIKSEPVSIVIGRNYPPCSLIMKLYQREADLADILDLINVAIHDRLKKTVTNNTAGDDEISEVMSFFGKVSDQEDLIREYSWASKTHADAVLVITMGPEVARRLGLTRAAGEVIQALRLIKKGIEERLGGQDSLVELLCREAVSAPKPRARPRKPRKAPKT
jgi:hypothetical protein